MDAVTFLLLLGQISWEYSWEYLSVEGSNSERFVKDQGGFWQLQHSLSLTRGSQLQPEPLGSNLHGKGKLTLLGVLWSCWSRDGASLAGGDRKGENIKWKTPKVRERRL